jgi:threonine aldolase
MVFFKFTRKLDGEKLREHLLKYKIKSFINKTWDQPSRFVTHHYVDDKAIETIIKALNEF